MSISRHSEYGKVVERAEHQSTNSLQDHPMYYNEMRLITWPFRDYNIFRYDILCYLA
jgi:hypothetical protein